MKKSKWRWLSYLLAAILIIMACRASATGSGSRPKGQPSPEAAQPLPEGEQSRVQSATTSAAGPHPRLFFSAEEIPTLQTKAETTHQEIMQVIKQHTNSKLGTTPETTFISRRDVNTYRDFGNQLIAFAFTCVITQEPRHCNLAKHYLLTFATWEQWGENNQRALGLAHMVAGNALAYDWLYHELTPDERRTVEASLASWTQKLYEASAEPNYVQDWDNWWRQAYVQNIFMTANSALGVAGLALLGKDDRAQTWIDQATAQITKVQYILNGIGEGSWHEGMGYQGYALTRLLPFLVNLRRIQGVDLFPHTYLHNYAYWRIYNHLPNTTQFILPYGDVDWRYLGSRTQNVLRFIAHEYNEGRAEWMAQQMLVVEPRSKSARASAWHVFEFLYYDPAIQPQDPTDLELNRVYSDVEAVIWRTSWNQDGLVFGLKSGADGGRFVFNGFTQQLPPWEGDCDEGCKLSFGHDHEDINTFYLYRAGVWLAPESVKSGNYETSFHNTFLIDGQGQERLETSQGRDPSAFIGTDGYLEATASTPNFNYVAANGTQPYKNLQLDNFTRYVTFIRPDYLVMLDNLADDAAHQYEWVSHFGQRPEVEGNWIQGNAGGGQILGVGVVAPQPFETKRGNDGAPFMRLRPSQNTSNVRFINVLYPTTHSAWNDRPDISLLEDSGQAAAVRVHLNEGSGRTDDILFTYGPAGSNQVVGPYEYDGRVAVVSRNSSGAVEKIFVFGGTYLKERTTNTMLVTNLSPNQPFEAVYSGANVAVSGPIETEITLYAPQGQNLTVNGQATQPLARADNNITFRDN